jgi:hypothetical protein
MKVFIWEYVEHCSDNYHSDGGVVVFADDETEARNLANSQKGCSIKTDEMPNYVCECIGGEKKVFIMPDAGCC